MDGIRTDYNQPVPVENISGQTVAGPSVENTENTQQANNEEQTRQASESQKGQNVDTRA